MDELNEAESAELFDSICRREMNMSGANFLQRYEAGEYENVDVDSVPGLVDVLTALALVDRGTRDRAAVVSVRLTAAELEKVQEYAARRDLTLTEAVRAAALEAADVAMPEIRLWVDDLRPPPSEAWTWWAKTSAQAILILSSSEICEISLDHDLGGDDTTRPVVLWMAEHECWPAIVRVHTANPVGRQWLVGMIERYGPSVQA